MPYSVSITTRSDFMLFGVIKYAEKKFKGLLESFKDQPYYEGISYDISPAYLACVVRSTVSDPEPQPVKKKTMTSNEKMERHNDVYHEVNAWLEKLRHGTVDAYQEDDKYGKLRNEAEKATEVPPVSRRMAIDVSDPENAMLLSVLEGCGWSSFYPPVISPVDLDALICSLLEITPDPLRFAHNWTDSIGMILAMSKHKLGGSAQEMKDMADAVDRFDHKDDKPLGRILRFLQANYVSESSWSHM